MWNNFAQGTCEKYRVGKNGFTVVCMVNHTIINKYICFYPTLYLEPYRVAFRYGSTSEELDDFR